MSEHYKETLNLPNTAFPMKANLAQREPQILEYWQDIDLYSKMRTQKKGRKKFILPDGPPYANGAIHIGHAVNKCLKDFIIKAKNLSGLDAPFVPGWDCHGLPIEHNVEKEVGKVGVKIDSKSFRQKCREYVFKQIASQKESFVRLGVQGDWQNPYLTMNFQYEADTLRSLAKIIARGHLHKGYKPVYWCLECKSALAEAEVEYQDKTSPSIDVAFAALDPLHPVFIKMGNVEKKPISIVIWTTTPWTLPANEAVALHKELRYVLLQIKIEEVTKQFVIAKELIAAFLQRLQVSEYKILGEALGVDLEGILLQHPFYEKEVPVVLGEHVTLESGTGCVHTAPAHGQEDYYVGQKYKLPLLNPVGSDGCYIQGTPLFAGEHVLKVNEQVIAILKDRGHLLAASKIVHSYPHCWRHKTPLIFRATQQWFVSMEQNNLRADTLKIIPEIKWIPNWGQARIEGMVVGRPDWCISRQRTWGVPMSLFIHKETGELHPNSLAFLEKIALKMEVEGVDAWDDLDETELLPQEELAQYQKIPDTLDVWFDSGVVHYCVLGKREELQFPADLFLEGSDQHRGWFLSSLQTSVAMNGVAPFKEVLTHGFTVDAEGRKMSKSLGNVVLPEKVINTLGADVLRLWVAATDYKTEMPVSDEILQRTSDAYRRIRNTARFLLANLNGFEPTQHAVAPENRLALDRWIIDRVRLLQEEVLKAYEEYQFHTVYQKIHNFCSIELGSFYLDVIKDRQYTGKTEGVPRRSAQTALWHLIETLVRLIAPILSFTAEEIWQHMPKGRQESVFLSEWYQGLSDPAPNEKMGNDFWGKILPIRDAVNKALEEARTTGTLGSALEAEVILFCDREHYQLLSLLEDELRFVLITSKATIMPLEESRHCVEEMEVKPSTIPGILISIKAATATKCVRCWHRREDVNHAPAYPGICGRCVENIQGEGEKRLYA
jgi:isoleucyl-tRNA synthetase